MRIHAILIVALLAIVVAAPIVDAIACDDCKDIIPRRDVHQHVTSGADHSDGDLLSSDAGASGSPGTATARDLCPLCSNIAAMGNTACGAPSLISHPNHLPTVIAFSDPSYSITKPPQN